jgi:hypothetical protein
MSSKDLKISRIEKKCNGCGYRYDEVEALERRKVFPWGKVWMGECSVCGAFKLLTRHTKMEEEIGIEEERYEE